MKTTITHIVKNCEGHVNGRSIRLGAWAAHAHATRSDDDESIGDAITNLLHLAHFLGLNLRGIVRKAVGDFQVENGSRALDRYARAPFCTCASDPLIVYTIAVCLAQDRYALVHIQDRLDRAGHAMAIANRYAAWEERMVVFDDNGTVWPDELTAHFTAAYCSVILEKPVPSDANSPAAVYEAQDYAAPGAAPAAEQAPLTDAQCLKLFQAVLRRVTAPTGGLPRLADPGMSTD